MRAVQSIPFLRIVLPFILGILLNKFGDSLSPLFFVGTLVHSLIGVWVFGKITIEKRLKYSFINGALLHVLLITFGFFVSFFHKVENNHSWYKNHLTTESKVRAKILEPLKETAKTYKTIAEINTIYKDGQQQSTTGTVILYFRKADSFPTLNIGDEILLVNKLNPIISKGNPGEFDYAKFSQNRGTFEQAFLTNNEWQKIRNSASSFRNPFLTWHEKIKSIISQSIPDSSAQGIALALITGYRDDIDKQVYNNYTKTGLVHLLAISGLHMGIFYGSTIFILGFLPFFKKRKKWLIVVSLLVMWLFALVTTFPPSVQRASIMFTFLGIGQLINRKIPSINFLFASAFFLLLFQPHLLFEVGFQLSYTAVLGILLFFIPLRNWYFPKNSIVKFFWELMCLSLSAQIFTFPIAIYYFHQLPVLFLFTNLVAIPLVMLIIYGEVLLILFSFVPIVSSFIGKVVSTLINFLNEFIEYSSSISFVSIQNIKISLLQCFLLLAMVLVLAAWFLAKRKVFAPVALLLFIGFVSISIFRSSNQLRQNKLVIYNANNPYLEILNGNQFYTQDSIQLGQLESFNQYTRIPSHLHFGITNQSKADWSWKSEHNYDFLNIKNTRILRIKKTYKLETTAPVSVDYLILSDKWIKNAAKILSHIESEEIIIDGNIPLWKIEDIKSQLREVNLPIHFVSTDGAKIISL